MKTLRTSTFRTKLSVVSQNRKYWLLLLVPFVVVALMWTSAASASCNFGPPYCEALEKFFVILVSRAGLNLRPAD